MSYQKAQDKNTADIHKADDKFKTDSYKADDKHTADTRKTDDRRVDDIGKADDKCAAESRKADDKLKVCLLGYLCKQHLTADEKETQKKADDRHTADVHKANVSLDLAFDSCVSQGRPGEGR
jgi:hypothetical protein